MRTKTKTLPTGLTSDQLNQLMVRYYSGENISKLINEFSLAISPSQITMIFPPEVMQDILCPYCAYAMRRPRVSRAAANKSKRQFVYCEVCAHTSGPCECQGCLAAQNEITNENERKVRAKIGVHLKNARSTPISLDELSLWEAITILALERVAMDENSGILLNIPLHRNLLSPTENLTVEILKELYEGTSLIDLSLESPINAFEIEEEDRVRYYLDRVYWVLRIGPTWVDTLALLSAIRAQVENIESWPQSWLEQLNCLAQRVALHEGLRYLQLKLNDHGFHFNPGEKTLRLFGEILNDFSLAQLYNFIWGSVRDASAYYLRGGISKQQAANSVVGGCSRRAERAKAEGWDVKPYRRDYRSGESELTAIVRNITTNLGADLYATIWSDTLSRRKYAS